MNSELGIKNAKKKNVEAPTQIQYISQGKTTKEHIDNIESLCKAGGTWVQLRLKNVSHLEYLNAAKQVRSICDTYGATFIVNDNIGVTAESNADGVHLGLSDSSPTEARKQLGENTIIGGTCNTLKDCLQRIAEGVDYIGLGPFKFTSTKAKLSPTLGVEGYQQIIKKLNSEGYNLPIVGIGGIQVKDISTLINTGLHGIAVSSLLSNKNIEEIKKILTSISDGL